ncbi:MAG TPA: polysaccharide biosynthesis/export family protein [Myxococcota bacterium]|jgi:polysaccharide export outer membrane protein|nr:polysaccharide biosynthesis/export family protein [Myxococcota bacterium]
MGLSRFTRRTLATAAAALALALASGGCRRPLSAGDVAPPADPGSFSSLGPGDVFEIHVTDEPELSGTFRVSAEGTIVFPFLGELRVEGKNPAEIAGMLRDGLKGPYLVNPYVTVLVKEYNSKRIYVFGSVARPGTLRYEDHMSIVQAITTAGGFLPSAGENKVSVTRVVGGEEVRIYIRVKDIIEAKAKTFELRPGDIVYVPESFL